MFLVISLIISIAHAGSPDILVSLNVRDAGSPLTNILSRCLGSGHATLTMREDWRAQVRMAQFHAKNIPYYLCTDGNCNPQECNAIANAQKAELAYDLGIEWSEDPTQPQTTFRKPSVYPNMK